MLLIRSNAKYGKDVLMSARFEGLKAAIKLTPTGFISASVFALLIFIMIGCPFQNGWMLTGVIGTLITSLIGLPVTIADFRRGYKDTIHLRVRYMVFNALLSLFVTLYVWNAVQQAQGETLMFAGIVMFAFMASGGLALSTHTPMQLSWLVCPTIGSTLVVLRYAGEMRFPLMLMFAFYTALIIYFSVHMSQLLCERTAAQAQAARQGELLGTLLSDFEDKAHDWLIEVDAHGFLSHASGSFAAASGRTVEELGRMHFYELMTSLVVSSGDESYTQIYTRLKRDRTPIRDQLLEVRINGQRRWWLANGQPIYTGQGEYAGWRFIGRDVTERQLHEIKIEWQAAHDIFTGLYTRYTFIDCVAQTLARSEPCALILIDLIQFKAMRTLRGQAVGDFVIRETAERLKETAPGGAPVARMSGSEFALLAARSGDVREMCSQLLAVLAAPMRAPGGDVAIGICAGLAVSGQDASDAESLMQCADLALTAAKAEGAGTLRTYEPRLKEQYLHRLLLIEDIDRALQADEFQLWYQPLVSVITGGFTGAEALIRWMHPKAGMLMPGSFIPAAEQSGKIAAIGSWVILKACTDAAAWTRPWRVSVNISAEQFKTGDLVYDVREALRSSGLSPSRLVIEITESVLIEGRTRVLETLNALHSLGVSVALDDFGSGFSSLRYLQTFPIQELKIDQSFVRPITTGAESVPVIETIIVLAKKLGLKTTVEGVETAVQATLLKRLGCDQFQGFLYSRPVPQAELLRLQAAPITPSHIALKGVE